MNRVIGLAYRSIALAATAAANIVPPGSAGDAPKWLRALRARATVLDRYRHWARRHRDRSVPLLWVHAPSVGEALQARPVIDLVRSERPTVQMAFTFFSPSAERFGRSLVDQDLVDFADYLPFDDPRSCGAALGALAPTVLAFSKLDVWPVLVDQAAARGVRLGLLSATLSATSGRRSALAGAILRDAYARLDAVGAVDAGDAERLVALGVSPNVIQVTGDTRYDQVWDVARHPRLPDAAARLGAAAFTVVAGSTWPADERVLLAAWPVDTRLIIAPHEPTATHVGAIERWARDHGVRATRLSALAQDAVAQEASLVIVDGVGVLGQLYALADVAYVGGGFHSAGLHSVLEPAAFGVPVIVGPRHLASRDATRLLAGGGARSATTAPEMRDAIETWRRDPARRRAAGEAARTVVRQGLGAARRSFALAATLIDDA